METIKYDNIDEVLLNAIPEFQPIYEEHVKDNDTVLPHILMGDFTRFFVSTFQKSKSDPESQHLLAKCVAFVELMFSSEDEKVQELIQVSFTENLQDQKDFTEIKNLFSNTVKNSFDQVLKS